MKQPSLFFRIHRWLYFLLKGVGKKETEHYLFTLKYPSTDFELYQRLADCGWQPNVFGYIYSGQIYQCRKLLHRGKHQYHVRCYDNGIVTGHFEVSYEWDEKQHLAGVDLRTMTKREADRLKDDITGVTVLRRRYPRPKS
jgi:hypothetical protein